MGYSKQLKPNEGWSFPDDLIKVLGSRRGLCRVTCPSPRPRGSTKLTGQAWVSSLPLKLRDGGPDSNRRDREG